MKWPLWAKIGVPGALVVFGLVAGASDDAAPPDAAAPSPSTTSTEVLADANQFVETPEPTDPPQTTMQPAQTTATAAPAPSTTSAPATTTIPIVTLPSTTPAPPPPTQPPTAPTTVAVAPIAALDPDYGTCKEAKAHGAGPYYEGQDSEYAWYRDADNDGIVCE